LIVQPNSNSSFIIDQALAIWLFSTYKLLFQKERYGYYSTDAEYFVDNIVYSMFINFVNISTSDIYSEYNITSGEKSELVDLHDLMFLTAGLSRSEKIGSYFAYSSYYTHQRIINEYENMFHEFSDLREKHFAKYRTQLMELLQGIGISGSAVDPNVENSEGWQVELTRVKDQYEIRLKKLRKNLYNQAISSH